LLVENNVTIVFHGHDHLFVKQTLDGIVYQLAPVPRTEEYDNISNAEKFAYVNGDVIGNSGHIRVRVSGEKLIIDYIRAYLPKDETVFRKNGQVDYTYTIQSKQ
jgi:hypothetical protein